MDLAYKIDSCGEPNGSSFYPAPCKSVYCVKCHKQYVAKQTNLVHILFDNYAPEVEQRQNIVHLTIVFDAFPMFTRKGQFLVEKTPLVDVPFPTEYAMTALDVARDDLKNKLRHQFPKIGYAGAFEWEVYSDMTLNWRKHDNAAAKDLLGADALRDPNLTAAQAHIVLFHAHIVIDLMALQRRISKPG